MRYTGPGSPGLFLNVSLTNLSQNFIDGEAAYCVNNSDKKLYQHKRNVI